MVLFILLLGLLPAGTNWAAPPIGEAASNRLDLLLDFTIPAQELVTALDQYSKASGMAVLVDRELAMGRRSTAVQGHFRSRQALEQLLSGTGLMALYTGGDAFTVKAAQISAAAGKRPRSVASGVGDESFASALQDALKQALCRAAVTRPGQYRAALQLWVGPLGEVQHSRLLASTGDTQRDAAIIERLRGLSIGQVPPSSLPQPVTVLVVPDAAVSSMECNP